MRLPNYSSECDCGDYCEYCHPELCFPPAQERTKPVISTEDRRMIRFTVGQIVAIIQKDKPQITEGEIYDEIAKELELRCDLIINRGRGSSSTHRT